MLLYVLYPLRVYASAFNVTRYITFRTAAASLTALALSLVLGPWSPGSTHVEQRDAIRAAVGQRANDKIDDAELHAIESKAIPKTASE